MVIDGPLQVWGTRRFGRCRKTFLTEFVKKVALNDTPAELIFNWDQTGVNLVPGAKWMMDRKGKKRVAIAGLQDKRQIAAVMCSSFEGEFLPSQLIYGGKIKQCYPRYTFPADWVISHCAYHWSNEVTMLEYIREVIVPFVGAVRQQLGLPDDQPAAAIFDHLKG